MIKLYPKLNIEELTKIIEEMDTNKDYKIDIDDFINYFIQGSNNIIAKTENSNLYRGALCIKYQRRITVSDIFALLDRISESSLYFPSFMTGLHSAGKNLPSEGFQLRFKNNGIGYVDINPSYDEYNNATCNIAPIFPKVAGYICLRSATGVPIPNPAMFDKDQIVNRVIKICFYDSTKSIFIYNSAIVTAEYSELASGTLILILLII